MRHPGFQNLALLLTLRADDVGLLVTFRRLDGGAPFTLGFQDHGTAFPLGGGLLLHGLLDVLGRVDLADLHALDADTPLVGGFVEFFPDSGVDFAPLVQRVVQFHVTQHGTEGRLSEVGDGTLVVIDFEERLLRVHHLDVDDGVGGHRRVVAGDSLLPWHVECLGPHVEPRHV